jgi:hypothetical protein
MGLSLRSLYLVSQYIPLSDAEAQAIAYHDGMYVPEGRSVAHKEEPLLLLLHWADMWTCDKKLHHELPCATPSVWGNPTGMCVSGNAEVQSSQDNMEEFKD